MGKNDSPSKGYTAYVYTLSDYKNAVDEYENEVKKWQRYAENDMGKEINELNSIHLSKIIAEGPKVCMSNLHNFASYEEYEKWSKSVLNDSKIHPETVARIYVVSRDTEYGVSSYNSRFSDIIQNVSYHAEKDKNINHAQENPSLFSRLKESISKVIQNFNTRKSDKTFSSSNTYKSDVFSSNTYNSAIRFKEWYEKNVVDPQRNQSSVNSDHRKTERETYENEADKQGYVVYVYSPEDMARKFAEIDRDNENDVLDEDYIDSKYDCHKNMIPSQTLYFESKEACEAWCKSYIQKLPDGFQGDARICCQSADGQFNIDYKVEEYRGKMIVNIDKYLTDRPLDADFKIYSLDSFQEKCFVSAETRCRGMYDDGPMQSLDKCINDAAHNIEALCQNRNVFIYDADGNQIAECSLTEDNTFRVKFDDKEITYEMPEHLLTQIKEMKAEMEKEIEKPGNMYKGVDLDSVEIR